ncbi:MAG: 16S rRNA (guanine(966)-N(2))-methyltransferase RsmD, partial [Candidatus Aerophobetes bacterium]|nr:16S rRNA (guanine(966)-N(2))-methyltransferase RsmD [Candidatus Aerophobetes bacterium]
GGKARGRRIKSPKAGFTRPLLSRVRKSLFDIIGDGIKGGSFLDLYAGSGAIGIEALSRGAKKTVFVEKSLLCVRTIRENLILCGFISRASIWQKDVLDFLPLLLEREKFDFIFIAPPYYKELQDRTLNIIEGRDINKAMVIAQHSPQEEINLTRSNIEVVKQKRYGNTILTFLRR